MSQPLICFPYSNEALEVPLNLEALSFWVEVSREQTAMISMCWGGSWLGSWDNSTHVSEDLAPLRDRSQREDQILAEKESKPLLAQTDIYF